MAIDYRKTAKELVAALGGDKNIINVTHCATRLRFILKDSSGVDAGKVSRIPGVITTVRAGGQFQVVIGNHVRDAFLYVMELVTVEEERRVPKETKAGVVSRIIDVISSIFAPFLYTLAACGILQGILGIFVAMDAIDTAGGTYQILNFISWTGFTFLPVLIAVTASKKFGVNMFVAVVIACALVSPDYIKMVETGASIEFLGIPVQLLSYTSSVIPMILAAWIASYVQRFFDRVLPVVIRNLFSPMFTIAIMVPLTLLAFGPVGNTIGNAIGDVYNYLYGLSPILAGVIVGGLWEVLVIFGVHWGITPVTVGNYANLGYDTFTGLQASAVFSQAGAAFGVFLKTKNKDMRGVSLSAAVTGLFGITEPAIYGVNLRLKRPMVCGCIAGAAGGAVAGAFHAVSWSYNMPGIATLPAYFKAGHGTQFMGLVISVLVSFFLGILLTYITGFEEEPEAISEGADGKVPEEKRVRETEETKFRENPEKESGGKPGERMEVGSPAKGMTVPREKVKDPVFSSGAMGDGVGIFPEEGKVYAPFDGVVASLFPTGHAVGLSDKNGLEFLIHIGINTVKLDGKGFQPHIREGDFVKKGDLLVAFDRELIEGEGFDSTVIFLLISMDRIDTFEALADRRTDYFEPVMRFVYREENHESITG